VQEQYVKLKELERLRDDLIHMIVHDMRTPLTAIGGNLELLQMTARNNLDTKQRQYIQSALSSVSNLIEMVTSLLDVSRLEEDKMELFLKKCDLRILAEEAIEMLSLSKGRRTISLRPPRDRKESFSVYCDTDMIRRVILNLLGNALKFTPEGGSVEVSMRADDNQVRVVVTDSGPGIPPEYHHSIFEKFAQVEMRKENRPYSTGLGLTFCKLAIEAHNGNIGVESEPGRGSRFWFILPKGDTERTIGNSLLHKGRRDGEEGKNLSC
jgi:signal transduction histidine kinase